MGWAAAAVGLFSGGAGILGANDQAKVDKEKVELQYDDNLEKIRRREFTQEQVKGQAKAHSENSGVLHSGGSTAQGVLDTMANEFGRELRWMEIYAKKARSLGIKSAGVTAGANRLSALSSGAQTGMSVYGVLT